MCFAKDFLRHVDRCNSEETGCDPLIEIAIDIAARQGHAKAEAALIDICLCGAQHFLCAIIASLETPEVLDLPQWLSVFDVLAISHHASQSRQVVVLQSPMRKTR